jgi:capping protein (actin filament) muscle Z-line, alpha
VLISKYGEINGSEYLDPRGKCVIQFDHIKQEVSGSRGLSGELDDSAESVRANVDDQVQQYVTDHYPTGGATVYASNEGGSTNLTVAISSSKFNPNNFWYVDWHTHALRHTPPAKRKHTNLD